MIGDPGAPPGCQTLHNEVFNIDPETTTVSTVQNPKMRLKRLTCMAPPDDVTKDSTVLEEKTLIRAKKYTNDHRDLKVKVKVPRGYKIIGVRCFKNNNQDNTLHFADFLVWKPMAGWLDISPQGRRAREAARLA